MNAAHVLGRAGVLPFQALWIGHSGLRRWRAFEQHVVHPVVAKVVLVFNETVFSLTDLPRRLGIVVAHVGLYEKEADTKGITVDTFQQDLSKVDRAILDGATDGFVRVHVRKGTDRIVGATIVAEHAGDLISELTLAMTAGIGLKKLAGAIHPYPTQAEAIRRVGDLYSWTRLTPLVSSLFGKWLAWQRE